MILNLINDKKNPRSEFNRQKGIMPRNPELARLYTPTTPFATNSKDLVPPEEQAYVSRILSERKRQRMGENMEETHFDDFYSKANAQTSCMNAIEKMDRNVRNRVAQTVLEGITPAIRSHFEQISAEATSAAIGLRNQFSDLNYQNKKTEYLRDKVETDIQLLDRQYIKRRENQEMYFDALHRALYLTNNIQIYDYDAYFRFRDKNSDVNRNFFYLHMREKNDGFGEYLNTLERKTDEKLRILDRNPRFSGTDSLDRAVSGF